MDSLFAHPLVQSALVPLVVAALAAGLFRGLGGRRRGAIVASAAIALAFLASYVMVLGLPPVPPHGAGQKLFLLVVAGLGTGILLDLAPAPRWLVLGLLGGFVAAGLAWIGAPRLIAGAQWDGALRYGPLVVGCLAALIRLEQRAHDGLTPSVLLLVAALGVGAVAVLGASASLGQLAFALAASVGGFMIWNWPRSRFPFGFAALFGGAGALAFLAGQLTFFSDASAPALALLAVVFFTDGAARRLVTRPDTIGRALRPVILGLIALIPVAVAVAWAYFGAGGDDPYR